MIRVTPAAEPVVFDATVRQPGLSAIDELVGLPPRLARPGPKRRQIAAAPSDIAPDQFPPLWRQAIPDLRTAYAGRCAYLAMFIEHATGTPTVDHFVPKSRDWEQVYEWSNYRLCAGIINGAKGNRALLDPFKIEPGWFALEFVSFQVIPGPAAPPTMLAAITDTIRYSGINLRACCDQRATYVIEFESGEIPLAYLTRRAPFIVSELRRAGRIP